MGQLPDIGQDLVAFRNPGWKALAIGATTTANFASSLSIRNLLIEAPTNSANQLLLNWAGLAVPLTVQSNLTIGTNGSLVSHYSALSAGKTDIYGSVNLFDSSANLNQVKLFSGASLSLNETYLWCSNGLGTAGQGLSLSSAIGLTNHNATLLIDTGDLTLIGVIMEQRGGLLRATNGTTLFINSTCSLSNATAELGQVWLENGGAINQSGGAVHLGGLSLSYIWELGQSFFPRYSLIDGELSIDGALNLNLSYFSQTGGTNRAQSLSLSISCPHKGLCGSSVYNLTGGLLCDGNAVIGNSSFLQSGGAHVTTNEMILQGWEVEFGVAGHGTYRLTNGLFKAGSLSLEDYSEFEQDGGTSIAGMIRIDSYVAYGLFDPSHSPYPFLLRGGTCSCDNFLSVTNGGDMFQSGGSLTISNTFYFAGIPRWTQRGEGFETHFVFEGGSLSASNIEIYTLWQIYGSGNTLRISNPGYFKLGGTLELNSVNSAVREHLGRFILANNAVINLSGSNSVLEFDASALESWAAEATLVITNWTGSLEGGGSERLIFGANQSGLTFAQLSHIRFSMGSNDYPARILNTGEVVPLLPKPILWSRSGTSMVLDWSPTNDWTLQSATNVDGPYLDIPSARSPYTDPGVRPQQFFRLRLN
jgi:hypothetical protein